MTLHIFNPEHDYALALNAQWFTPSASIVQLRSKMALIPSLWAHSGDVILDWNGKSDFPEYSDSEFSKVIIEKRLRTVSPLGLQKMFVNNEISEIFPWGWDKSIVYSLRKWGAPDNLLPTEAYLSKLRELSHRRISSLFNKELSSLLARETPTLKSICFTEPAEEFFDINSAMYFYGKHPNCYFKAPWSSSGRGIIHCTDLEPKHIIPWLRGIIKHQGSVMGETAAKRTLDFASEWKCAEGKASFLGMSVFNTSSRGKYHGNIRSSQQNLSKLIKEKAPGFSTNLIDAQRKILNLLISPHYSGIAGIDMISDEEGIIRPCIELNLRMTMGAVNLV